MRLLHVIASMNPEQGGVCQAVRTIIVGLAHRNIHNEVACLDDSNVSWAQADSFSLHTLGPGRGPWSYSAKLIPWLLNNLCRFDAVIVHGLWLYHGYAVRKSIRVLQTNQLRTITKGSSLPKILVMPHGMLDPYFQRAPRRKFKAWRNWLYWRIVESSIINEAAGVLFTCETERLLAHSSFTPYRPQEELVVGLGVQEPPKFMVAMRKAFLAKCPEVENRSYLLFLSRIQEKKGVEMLVHAYKKLISEVANTRQEANNIDDRQEVKGLSNIAFSDVPCLVIAGPGLETNYGQRIQQLAADLSGKVVFFPGMLTDAAKWGAFYDCEALVLPSHQENFGIAIVEALACGKPVLISNQVNIWREIKSMGGGIVDDDTIKGTQQLLESWYRLPGTEKQLAAGRALIAYRDYFALAPAARRMAMALERIAS